MLVREREPVVYTTSTSPDWSMASVILAIAIVALLGFMTYYFAVMHTARMLDSTQVPQSTTTIIQQPVPTPPVSSPVPQPVLTPVAVPQPVPQPVLVPTPSAAAPSADSTSSESSNQQPVTSDNQ